VTTAAESAAGDAAAIAAGTPSHALMQRAGGAAATIIASRCRALLDAPVLVFAGRGNNGGDGWMVARALADTGARVHVIATGEPATNDARTEQLLSLPIVSTDEPASPPRLVIDALLGTGASGAPRGAEAACITRIDELARAGARVVSLDVPSGIDATTGEGTTTVRADVTLTFGSVKRGLLLRRECAGRIIALDIGLADAGDDVPLLVTAAWVRERLPSIAANAHKGLRKRVAIVGGAPGMAGAVILAARAAIRSGVGMVRAIVAPASLTAVQSAVPMAMAAPWPVAVDELDRTVIEWADALLIGPGLSATTQSRDLVELLLRRWRGAVVLDADALNVFRGKLSALGTALGTRPALITPHAGEMARLLSTGTDQVLARHFEVGCEVARRLGVAVLMKGVPTVISSPDGAQRLVSATGNPVLAAAGSGDLLAGIAVTMLAQCGDPTMAGALAAFAHGRAAELATDRVARLGAFGSIAPAGDRWRGVTLDDVERALAWAWRLPANEQIDQVLTELPAVR